MPLSTSRALNLASPYRTVPLWEGITPRWFLKLLPWVPVKAGMYRINRVSNPAATRAHPPEGTAPPATFVDYEEPREIRLTLVQSVLEIHSRIPDLYSYPYDQLEQQIRLTVEAIKEDKERTLINGPEFGLLTVAAPHMRLPTASGPPTPDDLDNLLARVWKMPAFFLAHPRALAAFGHQCNSLGLILETVEMFGVPFLSWRGVPLVPCDKLPIAESREKGKAAQTTSILLMRVGEQQQGVVGLHQAGIGDEKVPSLAVRLMGIDRNAVASYLVTCYFAIAVLVDDALGVLENVRI